MKKKYISILIVVFLCGAPLLSQQPYHWTTDKDGIYRNGKKFFLQGQSWAKKTTFTYNLGDGAEERVKEVLTDLHHIGINTIRIYGSPNESSWDNSSNYHNLIKWIEEWNIEHPDNGDPNKAIYYLVQISPTDNRSSLAFKLPEYSVTSIDRAIHDSSNPESVSSLVSKVDRYSNGSRYLLGYMVYHELNISSKYDKWMDSVGAQGIESFMNEVADSLHDTYAIGKLVTHTGDAKETTRDIYKEIESLDNIQGNVFDHFDFLGFNLYISTNSLMKENSYYKRVINRRALSVNSSRGWIIGETSASTDYSAHPDLVAAANYSTVQALANLKLMWEKTNELGDLIGFMLFTVQDNDLMELTDFDSMKQRGFYDLCGDKKSLYFTYPDIINSRNINNSKHVTSTHEIGIDYLDGGIVRFYMTNKAPISKEFLFSVYSDDGRSSQRYNQELFQRYLTLAPMEKFSFNLNIPYGEKELVAFISVINNRNPKMKYLWGREYIVDDTVIFLTN